MDVETFRILYSYLIFEWTDHSVEANSFKTLAVYYVFSNFVVVKSAHWIKERCMHGLCYTLS